jgi:hypothetical protein
MKTPSTNHQAPEKLQTSNFQARSFLRARIGLEFEIWSFIGAWSLELGAY